jgi:cellulose synthase/poly-beta-1,6-N-acetylglucosamine synthase-like glycosyltransferase
MKLNWGRSFKSLRLLSKPIVWLSVGLFFAPMSVYSLWLESGYSLEPLQRLWMAIALLGVAVVNLEAIAVVYKQWSGYNAQFRGFFQHWFLRTRLPSAPVPKVSARELPFVSVLVAAYLPNEQDIILETLRHWLTQVEPPEVGWEVILAYNTPHSLPIEAELQQLAQQFPALILLPVPHSTSKAQNLNAALKQVQGMMTCIFDADHHPAKDCLLRAWGWLQQGYYDGVQGRNIIRNASDNWLTSLVAVEFECIYGVSHYGRSLLADTALFGGSNGYWRTSAIQKIGFHAERLTEDIDATLRALLRGYRMVHDPSIFTTELAPVTLRSLWLQRLRWSQGWMEVSTKYLHCLLRSSRLDPFQKLCWSILLLYSLYFYPIIWQIIPFYLSLLLVNPSHDLTPEIWNLAATNVLIFTVVTQVIVATRILPAGRLSWQHGLRFCLFSPLYFWLKSAIALVAFYNHYCGSRTWHVTSRSKPKRWVLGSRP